MIPVASDGPGPLRLYVPEWQGYAGHDGTRRGARLLYRRVFGSRGFTAVPLARGARLATVGGIVGRSAILRNARSCLRLLEARRPEAVFTLGGTCAVELAPVSYLNRLYGGDLGVVWLDAHGDLNTPATSPSGHFHGMVLRALLGEGDPELVALGRPALAPRQVLLAGARDLDPAEREYVASAKVTLLGADVSAERLVRWIETAGLRRLYLHLDLDVLDPGDFDEVVCPVARGVRLERLLEIVHALGDSGTVVGSSVVEFAPGPEPRLERAGRIAEALVSALSRPRAPGRS